MDATRDTLERTIRFGPYELDVRARELRTGAQVVRLQDQLFEILRAMLERPGDVVTRKELRHRLWPEGTFVDFLRGRAEGGAFVRSRPRGQR